MDGFYNLLRLIWMLLIFIIKKHYFNTRKICGDVTLPRNPCSHSWDWWENDPSFQPALSPHLPLTATAPQGHVTPWAPQAKFWLRGFGNFLQYMHTILNGETNSLNKEWVKAHAFVLPPKYFYVKGYQANFRCSLDELMFETIKLQPNNFFKNWAASQSCII